VILEPRLADEFARIVGPSNVLLDEADLLAYGYDGTWYDSTPLQPK